MKAVDRLRATWAHIAPAGEGDASAPWALYESGHVPAFRETLFLLNANTSILKVTSLPSGLSERYL